jgi:hypothetical protein
MPTFLFSIQRSWTVGTKAVKKERQVSYLTHSQPATYTPHNIQHTVKYYTVAEVWATISKFKERIWIQDVLKTWYWEKYIKTE